MLEKLKDKERKTILKLVKELENAIFTHCESNKINYTQVSREKYLGL